MHVVLLLCMFPVYLFAPLCLPPTLLPAQGPEEDVSMFHSSPTMKMVQAWLVVIAVLAITCINGAQRAFAQEDDDVVNEVDQDDTPPAQQPSPIPKPPPKSAPSPTLTPSPTTNTYMWSTRRRRTMRGILKVRALPALRVNRRIIPFIIA